MFHRVLKIGRWVVDFLFAYRTYDIDGVLSCLYDAYAPKEIMEQAHDLIIDRELNRGFTYTNPYIRRAVVFIGPTSSGAEFQNTLVHELRHLADGIAQSLGIELEGEPVAYLSGDTAMELADIVCKLGCDECRK